MKCVDTKTWLPDYAFMILALKTDQSKFTCTGVTHFHKL